MIFNNPVNIWRCNSQRSRYLGKTGTLEGFTRIRVKPKHMHEVPDYCVGLVKVGRFKIMTRITDVEYGELQIGQKLMGRMRRLVPPTPESPILYGVVFAPIRK